MTYGEAFTIQPFGNSLVTKTMTGAQIHLPARAAVRRAAAARRRSGSCRSRPASATSATPARAACADKVVRASRSTACRSTRPTTYRVTMNNFLASGGDGFTVFNQGTNALGGAQDIDALVAYFGSFLPGAVPNPPVNRITGT